MADSIKNKCGDTITVGEFYTLDQRLRLPDEQYCSRRKEPHQTERVKVVGIEHFDGFNRVNVVYLSSGRTASVQPEALSRSPYQSLFHSPRYFTDQILKKQSLRTAEGV